LRFFQVAHGHGLALGAHHDLVLGVLEVVHRDHALVAPGRRRAASLTRLARSAPEKPGVPRARVRTSTSAASGTLRMCTRMIFSRPETSGLGTTTWRSKRPGRSSAGQHVGAVGRGDQDDAFVGLEAVHLDQQLFSVCSRSSLPPPRPARDAADSVDFIDEDDAGAFFCLFEHVGTRDAPTPTNISTKSEPEMVKKARPPPRHRSRQQRLAGAEGRPAERPWDLAAQFLELARVLQEVDDLA